MELDQFVNFKEKAFKDIKNSRLLEGFKHDVAFDQVLWFNGSPQSIVPFELELSGVEPLAPMKKEPSQKKNKTKCFSLNGNPVKMESYGAQGDLVWIELFSYTEELVRSVKVNVHNEIVWLKYASREGGVVSKACRVDVDGDFWVFSYNWVSNKVESIISFASNGLLGVSIFTEYNTDSELARLYFLNGESHTEIYKKS
ncbi:hypothetical protein [Pseudomonas sp. RIT-PI-S]|uniref:hypothetical protein n=1 Tax=Pseudomonas sp. RIT-PI-S TaxID=3035295 RepID=UPI0021D9B5B2|nr:hypothetical protein [Pseudomonas sp. RIT-PI-S]